MLAFVSIVSYCFIVVMAAAALSRLLPEESCSDWYNVCLELENSNSVPTLLQLRTAKIFGPKVPKVPEKAEKAEKAENAEVPLRRLVLDAAIVAAVLFCILYTFVSFCNILYGIIYNVLYPI